MSAMHALIVLLSIVIGHFPANGTPVSPLGTRLDEISLETLSSQERDAIPGLRRLTLRTLKLIAEESLAVGGAFRMDEQSQGRWYALLVEMSVVMMSGRPVRQADLQDSSLASRMDDEARSIWNQLDEVLTREEKLALKASVPELLRAALATQPSLREYLITFPLMNNGWESRASKAAFGSSSVYLAVPKLLMRLALAKVSKRKADAYKETGAAAQGLLALSEYLGVPLESEGCVGVLSSSPAEVLSRAASTPR